MDYLALLKAEDSGKRLPPDPAITAKSTYGGFGRIAGTQEFKFEPVSRPNRFRRWRVQSPGLDIVEVIFAPEVSRSEVAELFPGARIEPLHAVRSRKLTRAETAELRALIPVALPGVTDTECAQVLAAACADPEAALTCVRLLAEEARERAIWGR